MNELQVVMEHVARLGRSSDGATNHRFVILPWNPTIAHALGSESLSPHLGPRSGLVIQLPGTSNRMEFDVAVRRLHAAGISAAVDFDGDLATIVALHDDGLLAAVRMSHEPGSMDHTAVGLRTRMGSQLIEMLGEANVMVIVDGVRSVDVATRLRRGGVRYAQGPLFDRTDPVDTPISDMRITPPYPVPDDESERLAMIARSHVLDAPSNPTFDAILGIVTDTCRTPMAAISIVGHDRQWFKAAKGLAISGTERSSALCAHTIMYEGSLVVQDALRDPRFADNPLVLGLPHLRSYLGVPLRASNGMAFGTLCAIDTQPRAFGVDEIATVSALARLVTDSIELRLYRRTAESAGSS